MTWAASYCQCPGCNGTDEGTCDECLVSQKVLLETEEARIGDCDRYPPQYACWMDVRTRASGWPIYDSGVTLRHPPLCIHTSSHDDQKPAYLCQVLARRCFCLKHDDTIHADEILIVLQMLKFAKADWCVRTCRLGKCDFQRTLFRAIQHGGPCLEWRSAYSSSR